MHQEWRERNRSVSHRVSAPCDLQVQVWMDVAPARAAASAAAAPRRPGRPAGRPPRPAPALAV
jgi:hypothetical protein